MTPTEKLKLKTTMKLFGGKAMELGFKFAKSGHREVSQSMLEELEEAMMPLILQYNDMHVQLEKLKIDNSELKKAKRRLVWII